MKENNLFSKLTLKWALPFSGPPLGRRVTIFISIVRKLLFLFSLLLLCQQKKKLTKRIVKFDYLQNCTLDVNRSFYLRFLYDISIDSCGYIEVIKRNSCAETIRSAMKRE